MIGHLKLRLAPRPVSGVIGQMSFAQISAQGNEVKIAGLNQYYDLIGRKAATSTV